jgi:hypothetical protein
MKLHHEHYVYEADKNVNRLAESFDINIEFQVYVKSDGNIIFHAHGFIEELGKIFYRRFEDVTVRAAVILFLRHIQRNLSQEHGKIDILAETITDLLQEERNILKYIGARDIKRIAEDSNLSPGEILIVHKKLYTKYAT